MRLDVWALHALLLGAAVQCLASPQPRADPANATAPAGTFVGYVENGTKIWRGVPYAEPPTGQLRWKPTVKKAPLTTPLPTKAFGADCAQLGPAWPSLGGMVEHCDNPMMGCPNMTWSNATSEDCLFLNVYAPQSSAEPTHSNTNSDTQGFPVVVYFPAGAFAWGAGNDQENNGFHKSVTPGWKDTVFVSANYRTGIFGFLASEELRKHSGDNSSGLYGIHDQTMVLRWVKENIAAFGGDPGRVMIYGESAGATSMSLHLVMPENHDLYSAVAIDSGAFNQWTYRSWDDAVDVWQTVVHAMGCDAWAEPVECMLGKKTWDLLTVEDAYYGNSTAKNLPHPESLTSTQWGPVVDGVLLQQSAIESLYEGKLATKKVSVLLGSNSDEGTTFMSQGYGSAEDVQGWCNQTFGPTIGAVVAAHYNQLGLDGAFGAMSPDDPETAREVWSKVAREVVGDFVMWCPARSAAAYLRKAGHRVYMYDFVHEPARSVNWPTGTQGLGAFHGAEVPFVFGDTFELVGGELSLSQAMSTFWTNMASSGDPNKWLGPTAPEWTPPAEESAAAASLRRALVAAGPEPKRPSADTFWWAIKGADCDVGGAAGKACGGAAISQSGQVHDCKSTCLADEACGGFVQKKINKGTHSEWDSSLKLADCQNNLTRGGDSDTTLYELRPKPQPTPMPPAPNVGWPRSCAAFSRSSSCFNTSDSYRSVTINITSAIKHATSKYHPPTAPDLAKCCKACTDDAKCKLWFVPQASDGTECRLIYKDSVQGYKRPAKGHCIAGEAPTWTPPKQCHDMFAPMNPALRVNVSLSDGKKHHGGKPKVTFVEHQTLGSCCNLCYLDYESNSPCSVWTMPEPTNGTCILYGGNGIQIWYAGNAAANSSFKGARKFNPPRPPPPPPPAPCTAAQKKSSAVVWPAWSAGAGNDVGVRLDLCNITLQQNIKKDRCAFWHATVDQFWDIDTWLPASAGDAKRTRIREIFRTHVAARRGGAGK